MARSQDLETVNQTVALRDSSSAEGNEELKQILLTGNADGLQSVVQDPEEVTRDIARRILESDSDEMPEAIGWATRLNVPFEIHGFKWFVSSYNQGSPVFFVVDAVDMTDGSKVILTTGAHTPLCQLTNLALRNAFPAIRMLVESENETKSGYRPYSLKPVTTEQKELAQAMADEEIPF